MHLPTILHLSGWPQWTVLILMIIGLISTAADIRKGVTETPEDKRSLGGVLVATAILAGLLGAGGFWVGPWPALGVGQFVVIYLLGRPVWKVWARNDWTNTPSMKYAVAINLLWVLMLKIGGFW